MSSIQIAISILCITIATMATRCLPFIIFPAGKKIPSYVQYLGQVLPYAVMGMLVVYCLRDVNFTSLSSFLPETIAIICIIIIHRLKHHTLLSIASGTIVYMFLVQVIF